jgi:hypothetical protein
LLVCSKHGFFVSHFIFSPMYISLAKLASSKNFSYKLKIKCETKKPFFEQTNKTYSNISLVSEPIKNFFFGFIGLYLYFFSNSSKNHIPNFRDDTMSKQQINLHKYFIRMMWQKLQFLLKVEGTRWSGQYSCKF